TRRARARLRRDVLLAPRGRPARGLPQARDRPRRRRLRGPGARVHPSPSLDRALDPSPRARAARLPRRVPARVPGRPRPPRVDAALERLAAGEPFAAIGEGFDAPAEAAALLLRWIEDGIIAGAWFGGGDPATLPRP